MNILVSQKHDLRKILTQKREKIKQNADVEFNHSVFDQLRECIDFEKIRDVASFISIRSEISTDQLNNKILNEIKDIVKKHQGYVTLIKVEEDLKASADIFTIDPIKYKISEKIKRSFDPKRIFNPGKMYTGI